MRLVDMEAGNDGGPDEFGEGPCAAAFHDPCPMDFDGSVADPELVGDRFVLVTIDEQRQHLELSFAEFVQWRTEFPPAGVRPTVRLNIRNQSAVDRVAQSFGRRRFLYEIDGPLVQCLDGCRDVALTRNDNDIEVWPTRTEHPKDVEAVDVREFKVQKDAGALDRRGFFKKL